MAQPMAVIVDDVLDLLHVMAEAVELALPDHGVATAGSAHAAQDLITDLVGKGHRVSLVITDQTLGGRTGLDLLAWAAEHHQPGMLLITGRAEESVEARANTLGAKVLWKPFRLQALVQAVRECVVP